MASQNTGTYFYSNFLHLAKDLWLVCSSLRPWILRTSIIALSSLRVPLDAIRLLVSFVFGIFVVLVYVYQGSLSLLSKTNSIFYFAPVADAVFRLVPDCSLTVKLITFQPLAAYMRKFDTENGFLKFESKTETFLDTFREHT